MSRIKKNERGREELAAHCLNFKATDNMYSCKCPLPKKRGAVKRFGAGFLSLKIINILGQIILCCLSYEVCLMHCSICQKDLWPLLTRCQQRPTPQTIKNVCRHCQVSSGGSNIRTTGLSIQGFIFIQDKSTLSIPGPLIQPYFPSLNSPLLSTALSSTHASSKYSIPDSRSIHSSPISGTTANPSSQNG